MGDTSDIDRLIEEGLNLYGAGDLDGALLVWEEALAIDPDNAQANSYVDYVRQNYELLTSTEPAVEDEQHGFVVEDEPEYLIEIIPGRASDPDIGTVSLPQAAQLISLDPVDAGWDLDETHDTSAIAAGEHADDDAPAEPPEPEHATLELDADEPPAINFDDATREYHGAVQRSSAPIVPTPGDFRETEPVESEFGSEEYTGGFNSPQATPIGFATQETEVRKRDLGFVQATGQPKAASSSDSELELGQYEATLERGPRYADTAAEPSDEDLLDSLPTPRPIGSEPESGEILLPGKAATLELPQPVRQPARRDSAALSQAEVMLAHAPTRELTPNEARARALEPIVSAPTRDLGLRPGRPATNPLDEDAPTGQTDARAIRAAAARGDGGVERPATEGTRHDIVLPFDPIAAQAAQILDDVDADAPANEAADERTRRRITRLLELAAEWAQARELDKAVSAVDLALSEDPNSALGQKLITRNKDTIMSLFQSYLGDLDRMPQLARPLHELSSAPISPRAAFLLSRIDGTLTIDELLDVSGMPRLEAYRHLCQLYLRGILR